MRRYLSEEKPSEDSLSNFERMQEHFGFLVKTVNASYGELDLQLRDDYFNVYFRGNSLVKVSFLRNGEYAVEIHEKFSRETGAELRLSNETLGEEKKSSRIRVKHNELHPLLQRRTIDKLKRNIRKVNYGEEITFEQLLISDSPPSDKFLIIDRQVTDSHLKRRMDLLALESTSGNHYRFVVIEVKLGKNPELREEVAKQLADYVSHISGAATFSEYKTCYQRNYRQKRELGLLPLSHENIVIEEDVRGLVVVGGYSALGEKQAEELTKNHPKIEVERFVHRLGTGLRSGASSR